jgi:hypothetical protein
VGLQDICRSIPAGICGLKLGGCGASSLGEVLEYHHPQGAGGYSPHIMWTPPSGPIQVVRGHAHFQSGGQWSGVGGAPLREYLALCRSDWWCRRSHHCMRMVQ